MYLFIYISMAHGILFYTIDCIPLISLFSFDAQFISDLFNGQIWLLCPFDCSHFSTILLKTVQDISDLLFIFISQLWNQRFSKNTW